MMAKATEEEFDAIGRGEERTRGGAFRRGRVNLANLVGGEGLIDL